MSSKVAVGYKFCGNCNPYIDTRQLLTDLKEELKEEVQFVFWRDQAFDILLIINGCLAACAERPEFSGPMVVVAADTLDYKPVAEANLKDELVLKIRKISQS